MSNEIKILVVDDEVSDREVCADVIEQLNYTISVASSEKEALEILEKNEFEIVVTDLSMETNRSGINLLKKIKEKSPDTQVIIMTAFGSIDTAVEALKSNAFDYITKPLNMQKLAILIQRCRDSLDRLREQRIIRQQLLEKTKELNNMQKALIESEKKAAVSKLITGIAHQLRNPIFSIRSTLEYCIDKFKLPQEVYENIEICIKNIDLANSVIDDLIHFPQNTTYNFRKQDINMLLDRIIELLKGKCNKQNIKIKKTFAKNLPAIFIDEKNLKHAILNILTNSLDAMPKGGILTIKTENQIETNKSIKITIKDTGCGISDEIKKNIFKPFYAGKSGGIGLGLSISKKIIEEHDGKLYLKSEINKGTTVEIQLPIKN